MDTKDHLEYSPWDEEELGFDKDAWEVVRDILNQHLDELVKNEEAMRYVVDYDEKEVDRIFGITKFGGIFNTDLETAVKESWC